jgi:uncharacterized phage infection (PIP) family protein YhgE
MTDTIGAKIKLSGDAEFKRALRDIDASLRVNAAEMKKVTAEFEQNDKSMSALSARSEVLKKNIADQTAKVDLLKDALAKSTQEYGESDKRTKQYAARLANAEAALIKMNKELADNEANMKDARSGLAELDTALRSLDEKLRVNSSEMNLLNAEYAESNNSVEALTAKNNALRASIETQQEKVEVLREALAKSIETYGEADTRTLAYKEQLNNASAELATMTQSLTKNEEALNKAKKGTTGLGDALNSLASKLGIQIPPALNGFVTKLNDVNASGAALIGWVAGAVTALGKLTISTAKTADDILTLSTNTGLSVETIQEFMYATEFVELSVDTLSSSLARMVKNMNTARNGTGEAAEAFRKLHVRLTDNKGQLRDQETVFYEVIDALGKMRNETERDAVAMAIFGRSARELTTLIETGSEGMRELAEEAHRMGYVMSEDTVQQFGQLDDAMQRLNKQSEGLKNSLAMALLPMLTALFETISKIPVPVLQTLIVLGSVVTTVVLAVKAIKELTSTGKMIGEFFNGLNPAALKTTAIVLGVVAALTALALIIAVLAGKKHDIVQATQALGDNVSKMQSSVESVQNSYKRAPGYARGTSYHPGGIARVGENGPEYVELPRGTKVYQRGVVPAAAQNIYVTIHADDLQQVADVVNLFESYARMKNAGLAPA